MELLISVLLGIILMEAYAWIPNISKWLLERAVRRVHADDQQRCREEWNADLNALPDGMLKFMFAIRNFSNGNADRINADLLDEQLHEFNEIFEGLLESHQSLLASFGRLKLEHAQSLTTRNQMERKFEESLLSMRSREWPNGKPKSARDVQTLLENLGSKVIKPTKLVSDLMGTAIESTNTKLEQVDSIFKTASTKRNQVIELLANRNCSPATHGLLESMAKDVSEAVLILKDAATIDETLEKRNKIRAKVDRERSKIQSALSRISK